jgi:hypothetical protein
MKVEEIKREIGNFHDKILTSSRMILTITNKE